MLRHLNAEQLLNIGGLVLFALWVLKRVADMERFHVLRVVVLSTVLSVFACALILKYFVPQTGSCVVEMEPDDAFTIDE